MDNVSSERYASLRGSSQRSRLPGTTRCASTVQKQPLLEGIFSCGGCCLQTCRMDKPWGLPSWKGIFRAPHLPQNHPRCISWHHQCLRLLRWGFLLACSLSSSVGPDPKPKEMVVTLLKYTPNSKCSHKFQCLCRTVKNPSS